jgi:twitching motility protein PilT
MSDSRSVGELLVGRKVLSRDDLEVLLVQEERSGLSFVQLVVAEGFIAERDVMAAIATHVGLAAWNPLDNPIPPVVRAMIPPALARKLRAVAVGIDEATLVVAMEDPGDPGAIDQLHRETGWQIRPAMVTASDLSRALDEIYGPLEVEPSAAEEAADMATLLDGESVTGLPVHLNVLLTRMVELGASDLHLSNGRPPSIRIDGSISVLDDWPSMNGSQLRELIYGILSDRQRERFEADLELDTSHSIPGVGRFRLNVFLQRDTVGAVLRAIPQTIVPLEKLGLPPAVAELSRLQRGLVLVTGPTGSGKSTTLASLVDIVNTTRACHIMTVEDPIEFLHTHKLAVVNQREVGEDTHSFTEALRHVLRQDPDVILVGEMRDLETISTALTAAETGHLVFGTLHTQDAPQSIDRMIDVFPAHQQQQIRVQLASALQAVVTQQLLHRNADSGRVVASEVLIATAAVRNLIREGKVHQLYSVMQGGARYGMRTMDHSLAELVRSSALTIDNALEHCHNPDDLRRLVSAER